MKKTKQIAKNERIHRELRVNLSDEEKVAYGKELGDVLHGIAVEDEKKTLAAELHKAAVKPLESRVTELGKCLRNGWEERFVECEVSLDFRTGSVSVIRLDTGEVIESRGMTAEERQMDIPRIGAGDEVLS